MKNIFLIFILALIANTSLSQVFIKDIADKELFTNIFETNSTPVIIATAVNEKASEYKKIKLSLYDNEFNLIENKQTNINYKDYYHQESNRYMYKHISTISKDQSNIYFIQYIPHKSNCQLSSYDNQGNIRTIDINFDKNRIKYIYAGNKNIHILVGKSTKEEEYIWYVYNEKLKQISRQEIKIALSKGGSQIKFSNINDTPIIYSYNKIKDGDNNKLVTNFYLIKKEEKPKQVKITSSFDSNKPDLRSFKNINFYSDEQNNNLILQYSNVENKSLILDFYDLSGLLIKTKRYDYDTKGPSATSSLTPDALIDNRNRLLFISSRIGKNSKEYKDTYIYNLDNEETYNIQTRYMTYSTYINNKNGGNIESQKPPKGMLASKLTIYKNNSFIVMYGTYSPFNIRVKKLKNNKNIIPIDSFKAYKK